MQPSFSSVLVLQLALIASLSLTGCTDQHAPTTPAETTATTNSTHPVQSATVLRVNAGLYTAYTNADGLVWLPDQGFDGGDTIERDPSVMISETKDPALFRSEHYGMSSFSCKIPNGKYVANLFFAETFDGITGPGQRVFSFNVQGHEFKDFDVWVKAGGPNRAYIESVPVQVTNGIFRIDFTSNLENPEINAVEIISQP